MKIILTKNENRQAFQISKTLLILRINSVVVELLTSATLYVVEGKLVFDATQTPISPVHCFRIAVCLTCCKFLLMICTQKCDVSSRTLSRNVYCLKWRFMTKNKPIMNCSVLVICIICHICISYTF